MVKKFVLLFVLIFGIFSFYGYFNGKKNNDNDKDIENERESLVIDVYPKDDNSVSLDNSVSDNINNSDNVSRDNSVSDNINNGDNKDNNQVNDNSGIVKDKNVDINNGGNVIEDGSYKENTKYSENDVVSYFMVNDSDSEVTIKDRFVSVIDFIFYDGVIKGYKFSDLTNGAKEKILFYAIKIDGFIDNKFPNYKESIGSKYSSVKEKLVSKFMDLAIKTCTKDRELCDTFKSDLGILKSNSSITWDFIKNLVSNNLSRLSEWYKVWKSV